MNTLLTFVHLSDIHFGQERKNGQVIFHNDIRNSLIDDVTKIAAKREREGLGVPVGVIVTGDIAFAGKKEQYVEADEWLGKLRHWA